MTMSYAFLGSSTFPGGVTGLSPESMVPRKTRATPPTIRRLGAPTGQPQDSPGQRPGCLRPESTSPEGAIQIRNLFTSHGLGRPFRAWIGFGRANPGALPRAGVGRAVGAPGPCKTSKAGVHPGRCPGLAWVAPLALLGLARHRRLGFTRVVAPGWHGPRRWRSRGLKGIACSGPSCETVVGFAWPTFLP